MPLLAALSLRWDVPAAVLLAGAALLVIRVVRQRLDRAGWGRRCRRCRFDLRTTTGLQCPECGHVATREGVLRTPPWRWRLLVIALLVALAGAMLPPLGRRVDRDGWAAQVPVDLLIPAVTWLQSDAAEDELARRWSMGRLAGAPARTGFSVRQEARLAGEAPTLLTLESAAMQRVAIEALIDHPRADLVETVEPVILELALHGSTREVRAAAWSWCAGSLELEPATALLIETLAGDGTREPVSPEAHAGIIQLCMERPDLDPVLARIIRSSASPEIQWFGRAVIAYVVQIRTPAPEVMSLMLEDLAHPGRRMQILGLLATMHDDVLRDHGEAIAAALDGLEAESGSLVARQSIDHIRMRLRAALDHDDGDADG